MKRLIAWMLVLGVLFTLAACENKSEKTTEASFTEKETMTSEDEKESAAEKETDAPLILTETEDEGETESDTETEKEEDSSPDSNWEGAAGCYYSENDITLEVVLRGTVEKRTYDLIFFSNEDGRETEIFCIENASEVNGNELRASKGGVDYLLIYQPDDELPRIRVKRENSAGSADLDGLYTIVMG